MSKKLRGRMKMRSERKIGREGSRERREMKSGKERSLNS
jgi:hypothetical protein